MYLREYYQADQNLNLKTLTNNTYVGIKTNKKLALGGRRLQLPVRIHLISWYFISYFLVVVVSKVLPGILPNHSQAICCNDCRS